MLKLSTARCWPTMRAVDARVANEADSQEAENSEVAEVAPIDAVLH